MNQNFRLMCLAVAGLTMSSTLFAADSADKRPVTTVVKSCESSTGQTKIECEKVARQIAADPEGRKTRQDPIDTDKMTHSSPAMQSPEEKAAADAKKNGKDPKKAVDKIREESDKPAQ